MSISRFSIKKLPTWLWYEKSSLTPEWTATPIGHPRVSRLTQGYSDPYLNPILGVQKEKRKLILSDWTAEQWSQEKITEVKERLSDLLQEGFEIYVWQNDTEEPLVKLTEEKIQDGILDSRDFRRSITPILQQDLVKIAAKFKNIAEEEIEFLNCVHVKELLGHDGYDEGPDFFVTAKEIMESIFVLDSLLNLIKTDHHSTFYISENKDSTYRFVNEKAKEFGKLAIEHIVEKRPVRYELSDIMMKLSRARIRLKALEDPEFTCTKELVCNKGQYTEEQVQLLQQGLQYYRNLRSLSIDYISENMAFDPKVLENLERLSLTNANNNNAKVIEKILNQTKNLSSFTYDGSEVSLNFSEIQLDPKSFTNLKNLKLRNFDLRSLPWHVMGKLKTLTLESTVEISVLKEILESANQLEMLELSSISGKNFQDTQWQTLPLLKSLMIGSLNCSIDSILEKTTALEKLEMCFGMYAPKSINLCSEAQQTLKYLRIDGWQTNSEDFQEQLEALPNIEILSLENVNIKSPREEIFLKYGEALKNLKELHLHSVNMDSFLLKRIIEIAPQLKVINIKGMEEAKAFLPLDHEGPVFDLPNLNNLSIDKPLLKCFLSGEHKIKTLDIRPQSFISRQTFKVVEDVDYWSEILKSMPRHLDIKAKCFDFNNITIDWFPVDFLSNLQSFYMAENFSEEIVQHILLHAKNLDKVSIDYWEKKLLPTDNEQEVIALSGQGSKNASKHIVKHNVDMHTKHDPNASFNLTKVFWGVDTPDPFPAHYRISTFDTLEVTDDITLTNKNLTKDEKSLELVPISHVPYYCEQDTFSLASQIPLKNNEKAFYGKIQLDLNDTWQPLPSLSAEEIITHIHIPGVAHENIDLKYSLRDKLYYFRLKNTESKLIFKNVKVDFLIKTPWPIDRSGVACKNAELLKLNAKYRMELGDTGLPEGASDDESDYKTKAEILEALQEQKLVGACAHRSVAYKAETDRLVKEGKLSSETKVRVVENDCHMYVEIEEPESGGKTICVDLGGQPANVTLSNKNAPVNRSTASERVKLSANTASIRSLQEKEQLEKAILNSQFNTWTPKQTQAVNLKMYAQQVLNGISEEQPKRQIKNYLVELDSKQSIEDFRLYLQYESQAYQDREIFYIDSPEDLICSANWIERVGDKGILREGPGGPLHAFLNRADFKGENKKTPVLVVNWNNFKPADVIKFNALYDTKERRVDGTPLPLHTRVVGLFNPNNPKAYKGNDFYRRWYRSILSKSLIEALPTENAVQMHKAFWMEKPIDSKEETEVIDLYESIDWKEILLGRWVLKGKELVFEEGKLKSALERAKAHNKPLEIRNGLWHEDSFRTFWHQEKLAGRLEGLTQVLSSKGYVWDKLLSEKHTLDKLDSIDHLSLEEETYILNPMTFHKLLYDYVFKAEEPELKEQRNIKGNLYKTPGLLQKFAANYPKSKSMPVYLSRALSANQWAELLEAAKASEVNLDIKLAPGVEMPAELAALLNKPQETSVRIHMGEALKKEKSAIYLSSDIYYTISKLKNQKENAEAKIINVSELDAQDLLDNIQAKMRGLEFLFTNLKNALFLALKAGETVILKGNLKPALIDSLASLCVPGAHVWINGEKLVLPGKLIIVSEPNAAFNFSATTTENEKDIDEYKSKLIQDINAELKELVETEQQKRNDWLATRSVAQLTSSLKYLKATGLDPRTNWDGLIKLSENQNTKLDMDLSIEASEAFKFERFKQIDEVLRGQRNNPFVFIAGSTGVGKSSFVQKELEKVPDSPYKVYVGAESIKDWVKNTKNAENPVLFIDEANIDAGDYTNYEGLLDTPPHMIIDGEYITLSDKHKVIFAGNPVSYGDRKLPKLVDDYGASVIFPPMSPAYLYHKVLSPILNANIGDMDISLDEEKQKAIGIMIFSVYELMLNMAEDTVLISPRELQMMALLLVSKYRNTGDLQTKDVIKNIKKISEPLVPKKYKNQFETFFVNRWGEPEVLEFKDRIIPATASTDAFLVTASRREIDEEINEFLAVRQLKRNTNEASIKNAAGLGGIILEGEPGLGKSEFVINLLVEKGFKEKTLDSLTDLTDKTTNYFYRMPVSMQVSDKEKLLLRAFNEGSVVIIDEMNSSPMMERLLNALLMGYDLEGNPPKNPGFMIIATQNPVYMAGRSAASSALEHRFIKRIFQLYSDTEMKNIIHQRGLSMSNTTEIVEDYMRARQYALDHQKEPVPTFGHVMEVVNWKLEAQKRMAGTLVFKEAAEKAARLALQREEAKIMKEHMEGDPKIILSQQKKPTTIQNEPQQNAPKHR